ncbi:hypothetical protein SAMN05443665_1021105 [Actinomadura meyerae]|uniref:Uncharacterized protein n=1 Tax=Actinomadura meyerae TaxID=240840 RepID=A0A239L9P6_9ACTN|nr:hypothetical protein [Actinomadura meyerae]SNT27010.1 hypothetical protein SAMN05443665_1021105 [Actinomadura meyerae]
MYPPQQPGPPPGGPGYPPPGGPGFPPPGGPGPYGAPGFPPPPRRGGGALVPLLIIGVVLVLALVGVGAFLILDGDDDDDAVAIPSYTPSSPRLGSTPEATSSPSSETPSGDLSEVLSTTIRTAKGNTFTRAGTRTQSCTSRANDRLRTALRANPCTGPMYSAVYADPTKKIITAVSIMTLSSPSAASSVSRATTDKGWPLLLTPSNASGLPQPRPDPAYWTRSWTQGSRVIYAQSYWTTGAATGGRDGSVFATAGELGVEVTNTLIWKN